VALAPRARAPVELPPIHAGCSAVLVSCGAG